MPSPRVTSFFEEQQRHLSRNVTAPQFATFVPLMDEVYEAGFAARPVPMEAVVFQLLVLCHRAFLIAVSIIARGHPDDDACATRRALEMAKVAFAVSYNPDNMTAWLAYEERSQRWQARDAGSKPKPVFPRFDLPTEHANLNTVGHWIGILSDSAVHFTPEYLDGYDFQRREHDYFLPYFVTNQDDLDRALRTCSACHIVILN